MDYAKKRALEDRIETLGKNFIANLDELRRVPCPDCGHCNLVFVYADQHVIVKCNAPVSARGDADANLEIDTCGFVRIHYSTDCSSLPTFSATSPAEAPKDKPSQKHYRLIERFR